MREEGGFRIGKPIDNSRVVRQVDPRSRREILLLILLVIVLAAGLGLYAWPALEIRRERCVQRLEQLNRERAAGSERRQAPDAPSASIDIRHLPPTHGLDLVGQRPDAREAHGEVAVVGVGEADAGGLDEQASLLGIGRDNAGMRFSSMAQERLGLRSGENGLVQGAIAQPHPAFVSHADRADRFEHDGIGEVTGERDTLTNGEDGLTHPCGIP